MKALKLLGLAIIAVVLLTNCATTNSKSLRIHDPVVISRQNIVDLEVSQIKVSGTSLGILPILEVILMLKPVVIDAHKENAIYNALEPTNSDVLVNPVFKRISFWPIFVWVEVTGYPARYKNIRPISVDELEFHSKSMEIDSKTKP